jgi:hypothetical protein
MQQGQQKPVQILAPNSKGAAVAGALPMVQVKQGQNGPQPDDGQNRPVVVKDNKYGFVATGHLPTTFVHRNEAGRPQIQTLPMVQAGPPRIPAPAPALSAPRVVNGRAVMHVPAPGAQQYASPVEAPAVELPPMPELSMDQLMFCRFLVDKALGDLRAMVQPPAEGEEVSSEVVAAQSTIADNIKLAELTIETFDQMTVAAAVRAEAEARAAAEAQAQAQAQAEAQAEVQVVEVQPVQVQMPQPARTLPMQRVMSSQSIAPAPKASYTAGPVAGGPRGYPVAQAQRNAGMAPRRVQRQPGVPGAPLPMVQVSMNGGKPAVQNQAEYQAARAEVLGDAAPQRGTLPMVQVSMNGGKPAVQNMDAVQAARMAAAAAPPPQQIDFAAPEGSTPE